MEKFRAIAFAVAFQQTPWQTSPHPVIWKEQGHKCPSSVESQLSEEQIQVLRLAALAPYEQNVGGAGL
jgi:hypothetical protein